MCEKFVLKPKLNLKVYRYGVGNFELFIDLGAFNETSSNDFGSSIFERAACSL